MTPKQNLPPDPSIPAAAAERPASLFSRLRVGRTALAIAGVEIAAGVASLLTGDTTYIEVSPVVDGAIVGGALYGANSYYRNGNPKSMSPLKPLIKDKASEVIVR
jgi:hypothetical protein